MKSATRLRLGGSLAIVALLLSVTLRAQTWSVIWTQPNATVTEAQAFVYRLSVDGGASSVVAVTCATVAGATECRTPRPALGSGSHTLTLTAENGFGVSEPASISGQPPASPMTIRVVIEITVP